MSWRDRLSNRLTTAGVLLRRLGVTADVLTGASLFVSIGGALAVSSGYLKLGAGLVVLTGVSYALYGSAVRASGRFLPGKQSAFFNSVSMRVSDSLIFVGVAWHFSITTTDSIAVLPVAVLVVGVLLSYERSTAASLGLSGNFGLVGSAERLLLLAVGLLFDKILVAVLWVVLIVSMLAAIGLFASVWQQAGAVEETDYQRRATRRRALRLEYRAVRQQRMTLGRGEPSQQN